MQIHQAASAHDFAAFGGLIKDYVAWCRVRFAADPGLVDRIFGIQSLDAELKELAYKFTPPEGRGFLARDGGAALGCCAFRRLAPKICEMKRLYVAASVHGQGIGRRLCVSAIERARDDRYTLMRLDTLRLFTESIALYRSLGFREREPYIDYPPEILPDVLFMELGL
jgi:ribosomal protein S18 acetylase RimI-like enzyme